MIVLFDTEICHSKGYNPNVAYVGMNYFDRYLSLVYVDRRRIELLSWCCLHLASVAVDTRSNCLSIVWLYGTCED